MKKKKKKKKKNKKKTPLFLLQKNGQFTGKKTVLFCFACSLLYRISTAVSERHARFPSGSQGISLSTIFHLPIPNFNFTSQQLKLQKF